MEGRAQSVYADASRTTLYLHAWLAHAHDMLLLSVVTNKNGGRAPDRAAQPDSVSTLLYNIVHHDAGYESSVCVCARELARVL